MMSGSGVVVLAFNGGEYGRVRSGRMMQEGFESVPLKVNGSQYWFSVSRRAPVVEIGWCFGLSVRCAARGSLDWVWSVSEVLSDLREKWFHNRSA